MIVCPGKSVLQGVAIGPIYLLAKRSCQMEKKLISDTAIEIERFEQAKNTAIQELDDLYKKAIQDVGEEQALIFDVHKLMLEDADFIEAVRNTIQEEKVNAEWAVHQAGQQFSALFASMDDDYMKARAADIRDVSQRVVNVLMEVEKVAIDSAEPVILLADDLSPSETVQLDKSKILAFVTRKGSANSHTAILARAMNIPALVSTPMDFCTFQNGQIGVVDGLDGKLYIEPDDLTMEQLVGKKTAYDLDCNRLQELVGKDNITTDGRRIEVFANIANDQDVDKVLANDAGGIGLFRSEFLYLGREDYPTEEEQFQIYKSVVSRMDGRKVVIRTLDIGADKQVDYFKLPHEDNPAMGFRAIRICLERVEVFKTQLRAIYRASVYGKTAVMFPMIISVSEIKRIKEIVEAVKRELTKEQIPFGEVEMGIMVETPAAVMITEELAQEVDFFSIGTNDLTQYTLAIDRQNQNLDAFYDSHHPAVLRMIKMTIENGHKGGAWVGICGELAGDTSLTRTFVDMGIDELSVSPGKVLRLRQAIREI